MPDMVQAPLPAPNRPFEIGLVMAGAISAGAYTAGVIDFLIEALDEWEIAREFARNNPDDPKARETPPHKVILRVMAGASAGGMTAGLTAGLLGMNFDPVTRQAENDQILKPINNNLYRSWVNTIDIEPLLGVKDLDSNPSTPVQSVLDSSVLNDIAKNAFVFENEKDQKTRAYVADPLHVLVTVTNLRGVPYGLSFQNFALTQQYEMIMHADSMHFIVSPKPPTNNNDAFWLKSYDFNNSESWGVLQASALATGAFPVGLAPRLLNRPPAQYKSRVWAVPGPQVINGVHYCEYWKEIPPDWPAIDQAAIDATAAGNTFSYDFTCVDGGVMNNEPLDLARRILAGPNGINPREGDKAIRAVIMVMPFPNASTFEVKYDGGMNLFKLLFTTFNSLIAQARFKPEELVLANDPDVYSRFLIVPRRGFRPDGTLEPFTIACGSLGGFGGFLSRKFREHDYQLGRRNCQWFLKQYFVLPSEGEKLNHLFDNWKPEAREKHKVIKLRSDGAGEVLPFLPIIPLVGKSAEPISETRWPSFTHMEFDALQPMIKNRLGRVVTALVNQNIEGYFWGPLARGALRSAWWFQGYRVVDYVMNMIRDDLTKRGLMK